MSRYRNVTKKTIENFKKKVNKLREATRKTKLQIKKKQFQNAANVTKIVESFFVLTKNVNASTFNNTNLKIISKKILKISIKQKSQLFFEKLNF